MKKQNGFTLMELLLVVALMAVIAAVGAPTVYHNFAKDSENFMVQTVVLELEYARSMGLMDLSPYARFKTTAGSPNFECATQTRRLDGNARFSGAYDITFDPMGRPGAAVDIGLEDGSQSIGTIEVTSSGLIRRKP